MHIRVYKFVRRNGGLRCKCEVEKSSCVNFRNCIWGELQPSRPSPPYLHSPMQLNSTPLQCPRTTSSSSACATTHTHNHITVSQISSFIAVTKKYTSSVDVNTCTEWSSAVGLCYSLQLILLLDGIGVGGALRKRNRRDQNQLVLYTSKSWMEFHCHLISRQTISRLPWRH